MLRTGRQRRAILNHHAGPPFTKTFGVSVRHEVGIQPAVRYDHVMHVATGTVVDGKIIVEGLSLPEGTVVTILTPDEEASVRLPPDLERELFEALDEADLEEGGAGEEFLNSLKRFG